MMSDIQGAKKAQTLWIKSIGVRFLLLSCCALILSSAEARVITLEVKAKTLYGSFRAGDYIRISGILKGELDVTENIPALAKADIDGNGTVAYATEFTLIVPEDLNNSNGTLLFDVENRGRPVSHAVYNSPRDFPISVGKLDIGLGFIQEQGFMLAVARWELGHGITLPSFVDTEGKTRYVEGVGFAVVRDFVAFLKTANVDTKGNPNPLAGSVSQALAVGYSQTGRFLKSALLHGFNTLDGQQIFDGLHIHGSGAGQLPLMHSGMGPKSSAGTFPSFKNPGIRGIHEPPFTYQELVQSAVERGESVPKIIVTNMANDYYSLRASLARTGASGVEDVDIPENVRIYDVAGGAHAITPKGGCEQTRGHLDWHPVMRAVLMHLHQWVKEGNSPPANRLMSLENRAEKSLILGAPPSAPDSIVQVPKTDKDGNDLGGIQLPEQQVAVATYGGQNQPLTNLFCTLSGSYIPFAKTKSERDANQDTRLSIEERYQNINAYVNKISSAAWHLVEERFMLPQDATILIHAAAQSEAFR